METSVLDEEGIRILLIGSADEIEQGLTLIHQHFEKRVCARVRHCLPGLKSDDLADCWQATLMGVFKAARDGRFDPDLPLGPYLLSVARAKGVDRLRRRTSRDRAIATVGETLRGTETGRQWSGLDVMERTEVMGLIRDGISLLPPKQKVVFQVFVDHYPETADMETLRQRTSEMTRCEETMASVKRALQEGRVKVREVLARRGYDFGKGGDR